MSTTADEYADACLSIGGDGSIREGYDSPVTSFLNEEGDETSDERWVVGSRIGHRITPEERAKIAEGQIQRWREWAQKDPVEDIRRYRIQPDHGPKP